MSDDDRFYGLKRPLEYVRIFPDEILVPDFHVAKDSSVRLWLLLTCQSGHAGNGGRYQDAKDWTDKKWLFYHTNASEVNTMVEDGLARWHGNDLVLRLWENLRDSEKEIEQAKINGAKGGKSAAIRRRNQGTPPSSDSTSYQNKANELRSDLPKSAPPPTALTSLNSPVSTSGVWTSQLFADRYRILFQDNLRTTHSATWRDVALQERVEELLMKHGGDRLWRMAEKFMANPNTIPASYELSWFARAVEGGQLSPS